MLIDIKRTVIKTQLRRLITLIAVTLIMLMIVLLGGRQNDFLGINRYQWGLIVGLIYILSLMIEGALELNYIYFSDDEDMIIFRYFSMSVFNKKKNSIEIPKDKFGGYKIVESLGGFKKQIILYQQLKKEKAKYRPVSITSLKGDELKILTTSLDKYSK
jgi:hypothetical protein